MFQEDPLVLAKFITAKKLRVRTPFKCDFPSVKDDNLVNDAYERNRM